MPRIGWTVEATLDYNLFGHVDLMVLKVAMSCQKTKYKPIADKFEKIKGF
jgi:hypothetical protein